jgi:three-Cys-motif partner protein
MSKRNDDFFKQKKPWSKVKDELLSYYLKPYTQKILTTRRPLVYIDCFAGKGIFEDGEKGSPLIALEIINDCSEKSTASFSKVETYFVDLNYGEDLERNLKKYQVAHIISGKFEEIIIPLLEKKDGCNIFLYIDPYGISALQYPIFESLAKRKFYSIELLINLNSFGFIREGCHAMGLDFADPEKNFFDDLFEYDSTSLGKNQESKNQLTLIAGGEYWIDIIHDYTKRNITGYEAETEFAKQYCKQLSKNYNYILNIPVKIKRNAHPKYRMIHATNHPDGCLIMVDNMHDKWQVLQNIQNDGQGTLFNENFNGKIIDEDSITKDLIAHLPNYRNITKIEVFLANFFTAFCTFCPPKEVRRMLRALEIKNMINIIRKPEFTEKGKPSVFMESGHNKEVWIRSLI